MNQRARIYAARKTSKWSIYKQEIINGQSLARTRKICIMNIFRICACSYDVDLEKIIHILYVNHDGKEKVARREDLTEILKFCSRPL